MSYKEGIVEAISELKDRTGSSMIAIKKFMQEKLPKVRLPCHVGRVRRAVHRNPLLESFAHPFFLRSIRLLIYHRTRSGKTLLSSRP